VVGLLQNNDFANLLRVFRINRRTVFIMSYDSKSVTQNNALAMESHDVFIVEQICDVECMQSLSNRFKVGSDGHGSKVKSYTLNAGTVC